MRVASLLICSILLFGTGELPKAGIWIVDSSSRLFIHGTTNVNNFTCKMDYYKNADTLEYDDDAHKNQLVFRRNKMSVPVKGFNCGNPMITRDFLSTLKADQYPWLEIHFLTLTKNNGTGHVRGEVEIRLAGVSKSYAILYDLDDLSGPGLKLSGNQKVSFADFGMKAPQKLMGLIQVQDQLEVEFQIRVNPL